MRRIKTIPSAGIFGKRREIDGFRREMENSFDKFLKRVLTNPAHGTKIASIDRKNCVEGKKYTDAHFRELPGGARQCVIQMEDPPRAVR